MRWRRYGLWLLAGGVSAMGCVAGSIFACEGDDRCVGAAGSGVCEPQGFCSFPDGDCDSGQRFGSQAGDGLAGQCVPGNGADSTGAGTSNGGTTAASSTTAGPLTTGDATTGDATGSTGPQTDPGLVAWYRFDDDPSDGVLDSSGNDHHGSCAPCPSPGTGEVGSAYTFAGAPYVELSDPEAFATPQLTVATWVRVDSLSGTRHIAALPLNVDVRNSWELYMRDTAGVQVLRFSVGDTVEVDTAELIGPVPIGEWMHVVGTWDGISVRLFINGERVGEAVGTTNPEFDGSAVLIGADRDLDVFLNFFEGAVDELRIYDRALSVEEISALMTG